MEEEKNPAKPGVVSKALDPPPSTEELGRFHAACQRLQGEKRESTERHEKKLKTIL